MRQLERVVLGGALCSVVMAILLHAQQLQWHCEAGMQAERIHRACRHQHSRGHRQPAGLAATAQAPCLLWPFGAPALPTPVPTCATRHAPMMSAAPTQPDAFQRSPSSEYAMPAPSTGSRV